MRLQFHICAEGVDKTTLVVIKKIRKFQEPTVWYLFPDDCQKISSHKFLLEILIFKAAVSSLKSRGEFRNVNVILPKGVLENYVDDDFNFVFNNFFLPETKSNPPSDVNFGEMLSSFSKFSTHREESVKDIVRHFLLEKFSTKNLNVNSWCDQFEKESARFWLSGPKQIEVLKSCLDNSMADWFAMGQRKFGVDADWKIWKADLIETFGDNTWKTIRCAYNFKFLNGSYIDYAIKKQKLLLDLDRDLPDIVILDLIILGLPVHIQNSFNKKTLTSIKILYEKLKKFKIVSSEMKNNKQDFENKSKNFEDNSRNRNNNKSNNFKHNNNSGTFPEKKPCSICSGKSFDSRFHPESACWFRKKGKEKDSRKIVNNVNVNDSPNTSDHDSKN
ncbi:hypothetical protein PGB90_006332 [Kerria lacca]